MRAALAEALKFNVGLNLSNGDRVTDSVADRAGRKLFFAIFLVDGLGIESVEGPGLSVLYSTEIFSFLRVGFLKKENAANMIP